MSYQVSNKLTSFLQQVNDAIKEAKQQGITYQVDTTRQGLDNFANFMSEKPDIPWVTDRAIESNGHSVPVRIYHPAPQQALPVLIHYHGGGHMCGSVSLYDPISRKLASICQVVVIAVDYRLAPEYPYPAGVSDCVLALKHYRQVLDDVAHSDDIYIIGDSAGGAICTTLAAMSLHDPSLKIDKQILIYPSVDYTMSSPSFTENGSGFLLEKAKVEWYFEHYFQHQQQPQQLIAKKASPLFMPITDKLPSSLVITAGCDPLRDEGLTYADKLKQAGVNTQQHQFDDMIHAYMLLNDLVPEACDSTYQLINDFLNA